MIFGDVIMKKAFSVLSDFYSQKVKEYSK